MGLTRHTWRGWLRAQRTSSARLMLAIGGDDHKGTLAKIEEQRTANVIDDESYRFRVETLGRLVEKFARRNLIDYRDPHDWTQIAPGAFMRKTHKNSEGIPNR